MRKGNRIGLALATATVLGGVVWLAFPEAEREPVYDGKPLDVWLLGYRSPEPDYRARAVEIAHELGTNAMPTLLRMLRAHDPPIKRYIMEFVQERSSYRIHYVSSEIRNCAAANACEDLGEKAKPCVPALVELLKSDDKTVRAIASAALKRVDPEAAANVGVE